jgi:hypothetical protein
MSGFPRPIGELTTTPPMVFSYASQLIREGSGIDNHNYWNIETLFHLLPSVGSLFCNRSLRSQGSTWYRVSWSLAVLPDIQYQPVEPW